MQREILLSQKNFETFVVRTSVYFLFTVLLKSVTRKYVFSLKRNQKKSEEGLINCSEICFL